MKGLHTQAAQLGFPGPPKPHIYTFVDTNLALRYGILGLVFSKTLMITREERSKATSPQVRTSRMPNIKPLSGRKLERIETIRQEIDKLKDQLDLLLTRVGRDTCRS